MVKKTLFPPDYQPLLNPMQTEKAIGLIKEFFQTNLAMELNLMRVTAPLFVKAGTGINDDLNGIEKPVGFCIRHMNNTPVEIVQSLAKWKRMTLADLGIKQGHGLYTDMNAIRPDEELDHLHSLYVDQWDWERVISEEERSLEFLRRVVRIIYDVIRRTERFVAYEFEAIEPVLPDRITFLHTRELERRYPEQSPREREALACKEYGAVFVIGIGAALENGQPHDGRAPDYDDWSSPNDDGFLGLNGDIVVQHPVLNIPFELSSMGIRVDAQALQRQLAMTGTEERSKLYFHQRLLEGALPLSIGGGIGQSRLCMLYLRKAHIGEIQTSIWPDDMVAACQKNNIALLGY
jgi:aspartate--ammonia ligase